MDNGEETIYHDAEALPLASFFNALRGNRFAVTNSQVIYANRVVQAYASGVRNENELCDYLSPIFAQTEEEQVLFRQIFNRYFIPKLQFKNADPGKRGWAVFFKRHAKKLLAFYILLALFIIGLLGYLNRVVHYKPAFVAVELNSENAGMARPGAIDTVQVNTGELVNFNVVTTYKGSRQHPLDQAVVFNWGDSSFANDLPYHRYALPGIYTLRATVLVLYKGDTLREFFFVRSIVVCGADKNLSIRINHPTDTIRINQHVEFSALINGKAVPAQAKVKWQVEADGPAQQRSIALRFLVAGNYYIQCTVANAGGSEACILYRDTSIFIAGKQDSPVVAKHQSTIGVKRAVITDKPMNTKAPAYLYPFYRILMIVFFFLTVFFLLMWSRETGRRAVLKAALQENYKKLFSKIPGKRSSKAILFAGRNDLPVEESVFKEVGKQMRSRGTESYFLLDIDKTIQRSIRANGLLQVITTPATRQQEYLLLIEENAGNRMQVKLFDYLLERLKKQNVLIEKYYYRQERDLYFNFNTPQGTTLEKLAGKYSMHTLIFLTASDPLSIAGDYKAVLERWEKKAVVTPASFLDWKEQSAHDQPAALPVFPADTAGWMMLVEMMANPVVDKAVILSRLRQQSGAFYRVEKFNFQSVDELERYCNNARWAAIKLFGKPVNILFEWIAALAIYPQVEWEMIIAVGKAVLSRYNRPEELSYTNLLVIVRIPWISEGVFPAGMRLALLKRIDNQNEAAARLAVLALLDEVVKPGEEKNADHTIAEQKIINEFSLYAYNPVEYAVYKVSGLLFEKMWRENSLEDETIKNYFTNKDNAWTTIINERQDDRPRKNIGAENYFVALQREESLLSRLYMAMGIISLIIFLASAAAFRILYTWDHIL